MSWTVELKPTAYKQYKKLDKRVQKRVKTALARLQHQPHPLLDKDVKPLVGELKGDYRLRVGNVRVLFTLDEREYFIYVYAIVPRGRAYK